MSHNPIEYFALQARRGAVTLHLKGIKMRPQVLRNLKAYYKAKSTKDLLRILEAEIEKAKH